MIKDLTNGNIIKSLLKVSLPVMGASLFQMAYQIIDMFWLGKLSSDAVAAVGTAGFYINISYALATLAFIGVGIKVSHSVGKKEYKNGIEYVIASLLLIVLLSFLITFTIIFLRELLISFFSISSDYINQGAINYLTIVIIFSVFKNINITFSKIFIGYGSGKIPLLIGSAALVLNIILDPILIFNLDLGIEGAAYATVISQTIGALTYVIVFIKQERPNPLYSYFIMEVRFRRPIINQIGGLRANNP